LFVTVRGNVWLIFDRIEFENLNIVPSEECEAVFFSLEELRTLGLGGQVTPLPNIFNPDDFKDIS
jgi:hypothetical protein